MFFFLALGLDVLAGLLLHVLNGLLVTVLLLELQVPLEEVPHFLGGPFHVNQPLKQRPNVEKRRED